MQKKWSKSCKRRRKKRNKKIGEKRKLGDPDRLVSEYVDEPEKIYLHNSNPPDNDQYISVGGIERLAKFNGDNKVYLPTHRF